VLGISQVAPESLASALIDPELALYSSRLPRLTLILLNLDNLDVPYFQEKKIRQALMMALNRQWMINTLLGGQALVADGPILPGIWAYYDGIDRVAFDPQASVDLLKDEGYVIPPEGLARARDGVEMRFTLLHPGDELHTRLAQAIQQNWAAVGVQAELQAVDYPDLLQSYLEPRAYQAALIDLDMYRAYDPDPYPFWHQEERTSGQNYSQWDDRAASEYIEQARVLANRDVRARLYRNFQVIFARELPALPLYYPVYTYGVDVRVGGVQATPLFEPCDRFASLLDWYLVTRRSADDAQP